MTADDLGAVMRAFHPDSEPAVIPPDPPPTERITGQYRANLAEFIFRLALAGRDDPTIAAHLGITAGQVRGIRKEYGIEAGEQRWRGGAR